MPFLKRAVEAIGGFDERLQLKEDNDVLWRLEAAGYRVVHDKSLYRIHLEPIERFRLRGFIKREFAGGYWSQIVFYRHPRRIHVSGWPVSSILLALGIYGALSLNALLTAVMFGIAIGSRMLQLRTRATFVIGLMKGPRLKIYSSILLLLLSLIDMGASDSGRVVGIIDKITGRARVSVR